MITLHGFAYSNYYNILKHVLLYKDIPFEEELNWGGTTEYLKLSPAGKIPSMTTAEGGHLSESSVCCDYLEDQYPTPALYPADTFERARVRQVMKISELYLELQARRTIGYMLSQTEAPEDLKKQVREIMQRGIKAINSLCSFEPYALGSELTMADIYLRYVIVLVDMAGEGPMDWDIGAEMPGLRAWQARMADSDISRRVDADHKENTAPFFDYIQKHFGK